jgi:hypothetical protein
VDQVDVRVVDDASEEHQGIVNPQGFPVMTLTPGRPCVSCGGPGNNVEGKFGGGAVCMKCGYEE